MTDVDKCETRQGSVLVAERHGYRTHRGGLPANRCVPLPRLHRLHLRRSRLGPTTKPLEPNPISFYGWSKYAAEKVVQHSGLAWGIARTVLVYGIAHDMSRSNIILWVKKSLEDGKTIKVVTDQFRSPTLAEDLAAGCALIAQKRAEGIFNISGKEVLTPYEMAIQTADYFGLDKSLITKADASTFTQTARRPPRTGFHIDKAQQELGYAPQSFAEGIATLAAQLGQPA